MTGAKLQTRSSRIVAFFKTTNVQLALILIAWIWTILSIATKDSQWDFKTYYYAAVAHSQDENPYDLEVLSRISHEKITLPFVYPLPTCYFFRPFTLFPYKVAYQLWLWLKIGVAIYLLWLWRTRFMGWGSLPLMLLIATGAYVGGFYRDLRAGNVTFLEQAALWTGFWWLLEGKPFRFALAIVAAAFFKITLAIFLVAALFTRLKHRTAAFVFGCALVCAYVAGTWASDPQLFDSLMRAGANIKEYTADFNHSTLAVFHDVGKLFFGLAIDSERGRTILMAFYLAFGVVVGALTLRNLRHFKNLESRDALFLTICSLCYVYVLMMPRMKNYTFILLMVPTYLVLTSGLSRKAVITLSILLVIPRIKIASPSSIIGFYQYLHPWLMAVLMWSMFMSYTKKRLSCLPWRT